MHNGVVEAEFNLAFASRLQGFLAQLNFVRPFCYRHGDYLQSLSTRGELTIQFACELVISIHVNAGPEKLRGGLCFHWPGSKAGHAVANAIMRAMPHPLLRYGDMSREAIDSRDPNERWLQAPRAVMHPHKDAAVPVLVELGYATNARDVAALHSEAVQRGLMLAISCGVNAYAALTEQASGTAG